MKDYRAEYERREKAKDEMANSKFEYQDLTVEQLDWLDSMLEVLLELFEFRHNVLRQLDRKIDQVELDAVDTFIVLQLNIATNSCVKSVVPILEKVARLENEKEN